MNLSCAFSYLGVFFLEEESAIILPPTPVESAPIGAVLLLSIGAILLLFMLSVAGVDIVPLPPLESRLVVVESPLVLVSPSLLHAVKAPAIARAKNNFFMLFLISD